MIPRILHRIWLDEPMPTAFAVHGERWRELHPGWEFKEWRDSRSLPALINAELFHEEAREIVPRDWQRFQADLLRLELLLVYGGVYVDCDVEPLRPLDGLLDREVLVAWSPNRRRDGKRLLTQAVLGSTAWHPFISACVNEVPDAVASYRGRPLAEMVGPHMISRVWDRKPSGVVPLAERTFYPQSIAERDRGEPANLDGAWAHHHWNTTARKRGVGVR